MLYSKDLWPPRHRIISTYHQSERGVKAILEEEKDKMCPEEKCDATRLFNCNPVLVEYFFEFPDVL